MERRRTFVVVHGAPADSFWSTPHYSFWLTSTKTRHNKTWQRGGREHRNVDGSAIMPDRAAIAPKKPERFFFLPQGRNGAELKDSRRSTTPKVTFKLTDVKIYFLFWAWLLSSSSLPIGHVAQKSSIVHSNNSRPRFERATTPSVPANRAQIDGGNNIAPSHHHTY
jgi:hypothetical protein